MKNERLFQLPFSSVYPLYIAKAVRKGRTAAEVDAIIAWLTGYSTTALHTISTATADSTTESAPAPVTLESFFADAPAYNQNATLIRGVVCGVRVEDIDDPLLQKIRYLDKLIDELAKGKSLERILRHSA
jgi:hypothetical protein